MAAWKPWQVVVGWLRKQTWVPAWIRSIGQAGADVGAWPDQKPGYTPPGTGELRPPAQPGLGPGGKRWS